MVFVSLMKWFRSKLGSRNSDDNTDILSSQEQNPDGGGYEAVKEPGSSTSLRGAVRKSKTSSTPSRLLSDMDVAFGTRLG